MEPFEIVLTADGSNTVKSNQFGVTYHSIHGAVTESNHVFIQAGLEHFSHHPSISIFEVGFGTGLNALLSYQYAAKHGRSIQYLTVEKFPLPIGIVEQLHYPEFLGHEKDVPLFYDMHLKDQTEITGIGFHFTLEKIFNDIEKLQVIPFGQHLIYFDAFAPNSQEELWTPKILQKCFQALYSGGVLVTYCAKGQLRRDLIAIGFQVERLPGPPRKREMLRATKPIQ